MLEFSDDGIAKLLITFMVKVNAVLVREFHVQWIIIVCPIEIFFHEIKILKLAYLLPKYLVYLVND